MLTKAFLKIQTSVDREQTVQETLLETVDSSCTIEEIPLTSSSKGLLHTKTTEFNESRIAGPKTTFDEKDEGPESPQNSGQACAAMATKGVQRLLSRIRAEEIMQTKITWVSPDDTLQTVITTMGQKNSPYVLVGQNGRPDGLVSKSGVGRIISTYLRPEFVNQGVLQNNVTLSFKLNWMNFKIKWTMSHPVHTVKPESNLSDAMVLMNKLQVRCLLVVNPENQVLGLVTESDIFRKLQGLLALAI